LSNTTLSFFVVIDEWADDIESTFNLNENKDHHKDFHEHQEVHCVLVKLNPVEITTKSWQIDSLSVEEHNLKGETYNVHEQAESHDVSEAFDTFTALQDVLLVIDQFSVLLWW
jgi:hypothetical protein